MSVISCSSSDLTHLQRFPNYLLNVIADNKSSGGNHTHANIGCCRSNFSIEFASFFADHFQCELLLRFCAKSIRNPIWFRAMLQWGEFQSKTKTQAKTLNNKSHLNFGKGQVIFNFETKWVAIVSSLCPSGDIGTKTFRLNAKIWSTEKKALTHTHAHSNIEATLKFT